MNQQSASRTAMLVSALRARATARPDPLCTDPWAAQLAGDTGMALTYRHDRIYPASELWIALRTAWIDYRKFRRVSFDEICLALTSTYERSRKFRCQHIVEASRNQLHSSW